MRRLATVKALRLYLAAVKIFLRQAIREKEIPFQVKLNLPNKYTSAAIRQGTTIAYDITVTGYGNMSDLKAVLEVEAGSYVYNIPQKYSLYLFSLRCK